MFPLITHISDMLPHIEGNKSLRVITQPNGFKIISYMISDSTTFENDWLRECRSIIFDREGKVAGRSFHKFFNLNEKEFTRAENLNWDNLETIGDKLDGSMIYAFLDGDEICVTSKKSMNSDISKHALEYVKERKNYQDLIKECCKNFWTPIFEFTTPKQRIVIDYPEDTMTLLAVRHWYTGEYLTYHQMSDGLASSYNIPVVKANPVKTLQELVNELLVANDIEGYVLKFKDGCMVKMKADSYMALHHVITFIRVRDVVGLILDEQLDDLKPKYADDPERIRKIERLETIVSNRIDEIESQVRSLVDANKGLSKKEMAAKFCKHELMHLIMKLVNGSDLRFHVVVYYKKYFLKTWTLEQLDHASIFD